MVAASDCVAVSASGVPIQEIEYEDILKATRPSLLWPFVGHAVINTAQSSPEEGVSLCVR